MELLLSRNGFHDVARIYRGPEYDVVSVRVAGGEAVDAWRRLQAILAPARAWPVIIGEVKQEESLVESLKDSETTSLAAISDQANVIEPLDWFRRRRQSDPSYVPPRAPAWKRPFREPCGRGGTLVGPVDLTTNRPYERVSIVIVPTRDSWAAPAFLKYGGWNECPGPAEQVALLRYWHDAYNTDVATMASDIIELSVPRPISTRQEALAVAEQQFLYCSDIVHQGTETIDCLADEITGAPFWYFWWD